VVGHAAEVVQFLLIGQLLHIEIFCLLSCGAIIDWRDFGDVHLLVLELRVAGPYDEGRVVLVGSILERMVNIKLSLIRQRNKESSRSSFDRGRDHPRTMARQGVPKRKEKEASVAPSMKVITLTTSVASPGMLKCYYGANLLSPRRLKGYRRVKGEKRDLGETKLWDGGGDFEVI
jgi:hypothetical protein